VVTVEAPGPPRPGGVVRTAPASSVETATRIIKILSTEDFMLLPSFGRLFNMDFRFGRQREHHATSPDACCREFFSRTARVMKPLDSSNNFLNGNGESEPENYGSRGAGTCLILHTETHRSTAAAERGTSRMTPAQDERRPDKRSAFVTICSKIVRARLRLRRRSR
jgi:hypothetical protein